MSFGNRWSSRLPRSRDMPKRYAEWTDYPRRKDNDGRWLCRWCGEPLSGRRTAWCSKACEREVAIRCGHHVRRAVWLRDKGMCSKCGRDTNAIRRRLRQVRREEGFGAWTVAFERLGLTCHEALKTLWEAHHVKAVEEGGGVCGVDGYVTLCVWCHRVETKKQAVRRCHA